MASASEIIVPISTTKHDPAWKHCLMVQSSEKTKLKCVYCSKQFLGGGIHRFKEHLARQKGNASCCPSVPSDVQEAMLRSLESTTTRKKRRHGDAEDSDNGNTNSGQVDGIDMVRPLHIIPLNDVLDMSPAQVETKQDGLLKKSQRGRRKKTGLSSQQQLVQPTLTTGDMISLAKHASSGDAEKDQLYRAIAKFLYEAGISLEVVRSVYFQPMLDVIASSGPQLETFSYHDFRGWILKKSLEELKNQLEFSKASWSRTGCSILVDEWTTEKGNSMIDFSVYSPEGITFLRSVDATDIITSPDSLYMLYRDMVEEVGVKNVVQLITSNSDNHMIAGRHLTDTFPTMFWSPCAFQCIDEILEDFVKLGAFSEIIGNAKTVTGTIYSNAVALNLMRKYTHGKDLVLHAETRAAVNFVTLKNMYSLRENLRAMVNSSEWLDCLLSKRPGGLAATNFICSSTFWSSCAAAICIAEPLVQLLKLVYSSKRPAMGYIYVGLYRAKELIKKQLVKKNEYMPYWNIIQQRWARQLQHPLHAAGYFLNPLFFESIRGDISNTLSSGLLDCIERLVTDAKVQDKIQKELNLYRSEGATDFRRKMAIRARHTLTPTDWWYTYGRCCPNLMHLAIRILSQTCSARGCDQTRIPLERVHLQEANPLERQRMVDLTFVQYNLRMQHRQRPKIKAFDPIAIDNANIVADWILDKNAILSGEIEQTCWTELNQPANGALSSDSNEDDIETFIAGLDVGIIRGAAQDLRSSDNDSGDDEVQAFG